MRGMRISHGRRATASSASARVMSRRCGNTFAINRSTTSRRNSKRSIAGFARRTGNHWMNDMRGIESRRLCVRFAFPGASPPGASPQAITLRAFGPPILRGLGRRVFGAVCPVISPFWCPPRAHAACTTVGQTSGLPVHASSGGVFLAHSASLGLPNTGPEAPLTGRPEVCPTSSSPATVVRRRCAPPGAPRVFVIVSVPRNGYEVG